MIESKFVEQISSIVGADPAQVSVSVDLFDKGATVPFVARYRKDITGNLDEVKLEAIQTLNTRFIALTNRRDAVLENIEKQGMLTEELKARILACDNATVLEDLYLPFKKNRKTKASAAREQGLEPLADFVWAQVPGERTLEEEAERYLNPEKGIPDAASALQGARHILAERMAQDASLREYMRRRFYEEGTLKTSGTKHAEGQKTKFEAYYDFNEPIKSIPSHRLLAVLRGVRLGFLRMDLIVDEDALLVEMGNRFLKDPASPFAPMLQSTMEDSLKRLIRPAIENEVIQQARVLADEAATGVFRENAENLLLAAPVGQKVVLGVDPGLRTGAKLAVIDAHGGYLESATIYPTEPKNDIAGATETLIGLVERFGVELIAIGNGTGSKEASRFVKNALKDRQLDKITVVMVNEAGASIYSASHVARDEFPELDLTIRGAISIARRLQDPLAELVKLEPRNVGVGQYQHDVNQKQLREGLVKTVELCVNRVGVDINTASVELLRFISGIQQNTAQNIVNFRQENGPFTSRTQLLEVSGIGEKTYEQCAGFLRIQNGIEPLDQTSIHPEAYGTVESMAESLAVNKADLIRNRELLEKINLGDFAAGTVGRLTLADIKSELLKPGRDPREEFQAPVFLDGVDDVDDLKPDMVTEGVVTNVTDFGAFVDIGVHQDGLIHLSELANHFVRDPHDVVKVGQIVQVKVIQIDADRRRVSLSMKALQPAVRAPRKVAQDDRPVVARAHRDQQDKSSAPDSRRVDIKRGDRGLERGSKRDGKASYRGRKEEKGRALPRAQSTPPKDQMNTLLADQLAALRDKFNS